MNPVSRLASTLARWLLVVLVMAWALVPIFWMVLSSFKPTGSITSNPPQLFFSPTLAHYEALVTGVTTSGAMSTAACW